jgi:CRP-like cAMP-binding protein
MRQAACRLLQSWWIRKSYHPRTVQALRNFKNKHIEYRKFIHDENEATESRRQDKFLQEEQGEQDDTEGRQMTAEELELEEEMRQDRQLQDERRVQQARESRQFARFTEVANNIMLKGAVGLVLLAPPPTIARLKSYCNERSGEIFIAIPLILFEDESISTKLIGGQVVDLIYTFDDGDDDIADEASDGKSDADLTFGAVPAKDPAFALRRALFCPSVERTKEMRAILLELMSAFRRCFNDLTDVDVSKLISAAEHRWMSSNATIFLQGTPHDVCYVVANGRLEIVSKDVEDRPIAHLGRSLGAGGYIGELAVVRDDGVRTHDAFAGLEGVDLLIITRENFQAMVQERRVKQLVDVAAKGAEERSQDEILDLLAFLGIGEAQPQLVWHRPHLVLKKPSKTPLARRARAALAPPPLRRTGSAERTGSFGRSNSFGRTGSGGSSGLASLLKAVRQENSRL